MKSTEAGSASVLTMLASEDADSPLPEGSPAESAIAIDGPDPPETHPFQFAPRAVTMAPVGRLGSWHLRAGQTPPSMCEVLNRRGVTYAVIPAATGDRPALLVSDGDASRINDLISRVPAGRQLAVYAATDLPGFTFQQHWRKSSDATSMAVLPAHLAVDLLSSTRMDAQGQKVPGARHLLLWEIYRALFLNGDSHFALRPTDPEPILVGPQSHVIRSLARETGTSLPEPLTLAALHEHLSTSGWAPPVDVLRRICCWNSWAAFKVRKWAESRPAEEPGMVVFFVRRAVLDNRMEQGISAIIDTGGFEVLKAIDLTEAQIDATAKAMRGGNWGPGAFAVNGGPPVRILIAFDVAPAPVTDAVRDKYPQLDNLHILEAKLRCREYIDDRLPPSGRFNPVHSTDDSAQAWDVVRLFAADEEAEFRATIDRRKAAFATQFEIVRSLTRTGLRAKIEVIRYRGGVAVKKTFRDNCLRYMQREASFMDAISPHRREIPPVLERGPNYIIMPFIDGRPLRRSVLGRSIPRLMTLKQVRAIADLLRFLFARGYDPIDVGPHNLLVDRSGELRAIDFEFVHRNDGPVDPDRAACLHGIPDDFDGEWPPKALWCPQRAKCVDPWRFRWFAVTGLSVQSFLNDPPGVQRIKRCVNYPVHLGTKALQIQHQWLRDRAALSLKRRLPVMTRMVRNALRTRRA